MKILIEDNLFVTLWYYSDEAVVYHRIKPVEPPYNQQHRKLFRATLLKGASLLKEHNACKWLSNDIDSIPLPAHDIEWGEKEWAPKAMVSGWRYWAKVVPKDAVTQLNASNIIGRLASFGIQANHVANEEEGMAWLAKSSSRN